MAKLKDAAKEAGSALLQPEGLATGALAGWLFGGPVGALVGVGQGIIAKRLRQSQLDDAAAEQEVLSALDAQMQAATEAAFSHGATDLDAEQLDQEGRVYASLRALANHPNPDVRERAIEKLAEHGTRVGAWLEDIETRNEAQTDANVAILDKESDLARAAFDDGLAQAQETKRVASELHELLADESFDVNHPLNRGRLGALFNQTPRELLSDPEDMADALRDVGGAVPLLGAVALWSAGKQSAEDFMWSKEDWRKIAFAMQKSADKKSQRIMDDAIHVGSALDQAAASMGHKPTYSYLERIAAGRVQGGADIASRPGAYGTSRGQVDEVGVVRGAVDRARDATSGFMDRLRRIGANPNPPSSKRRVNE